MAPEMVILRLRKKMDARNHQDEEFSQELSQIYENYKEQIEGFPSYYYGDKVDIWATGVVIYKILTGNYAYGGEKLMTLFLIFKPSLMHS